MSPQRSIAHYRIVSKLGEGGMGAVYQAIDSKLNREVAIKVLSEGVAQDAGRMLRFGREAQVLASLNHPNIASVYGVEQGAIIMELVDGEGLRGPLPVETALNYVRQIASGLEAAHEKGIVHRDLKPANIMVTREGVIKILDFGLAKETDAVSPSTANPSMSPTLSLEMTQAGMILGTAGYMSPEQARGKPVDKRADIWAFGVVLFELLTGKPVFVSGGTVTDTIAAVITREPDWSALPKDTPAHVRRLLERCLRKDPKLRLRDIGDARITLEDPEPVPVAVGPRRSWLTWAACAVALVSLGAATFAWMRPSPANPGAGTMRFRIPLPPGTAVPPGKQTAQWTLSPDGRNLAMVVDVQGRNRLWLRPLGSPDAHPLDNTDDANIPFWSPDSRSIGFFTKDQIKRVAIDGGAVFTVCSLPNGRGDDGAAWSKDGSIVFGSGSGPLMRVPATGGVPSALTSLSKDEQSHHWPQLLPDGRHVLYLSMALPGAGANAVYVQDLASGSRARVIESDTRAIWSPPGFLLFTRGAALFAQPLDSRSFQLQGEPTLLGENVLTNETNGRSTVSASENGMLIYRVFPSGDRQIAWHDDHGRVLSAVGKPGPYRSLGLSPDEKTLAVLSGVDIGKAAKVDLWAVDLASGAMTALTRDGNLEPTNLPVWSPDSQTVAVSPRGGGIESIAVASGRTQTLSREKLLVQAWSPDGRSILCTDVPNHLVALVSLAQPDKPQEIRTTPYQEYAFHLSPDGTHVVYVSTEAEASGIYVASFPSFAEKRKVSLGPGRFPTWGRNGKSVFYLSGDGLVEAQVQTAPHIQIGERLPLFKLGGVGPQRFASTADGQRFLIMDPIQQQDLSSADLVLMVDWPSELRRQ